MSAPVVAVIKPDSKGRLALRRWLFRADAPVGYTVRVEDDGRKITLEVAD